MRDGQVYAMQEANLRRSGLLLGQFQFLETRQRAFEIVFKSSTLRQRIAYLWSPAAFIQAVDALQIQLLNQEKEKMERAAVAPKLTVVRNGPAGVVPVG